MSQNRRSFIGLSLLLGSVVFSSGLFAQTETVYFTGPSNEISVVDSFANGTSTTVINVSGSNFKGLAFRPNDELLLIANPTQGGGLFICSPEGACGEITVLSDAVAVALDPDENLYGVSDGPHKLIIIPRDDACASVLFPTGCNPGGYDADLALELDIDLTTRLADVTIVPSDGGGLFQGDIVLLSRSPGRILRMAKLDPSVSCDGSVIDPDCWGAPEEIVSLSGFEPTGFTFAPNGDFLISTWDGDVLRRSRDDSTGSVFATLPNSGSGLHIDVGVQEGESQVVVAVHQSGIIQRYLLDGNENGHVTTSVNSPHGVVIGTSTFAPTIAGTNVVNTFSGIVTTWTTVIDDGISTVKCTTENDPRQGASFELSLCVNSTPNNNDPSLSYDPSLCASESGCDGSDCGLDLGIPAKIPSFAGSFQNLGGTHVVRLCEATTTASIQGVISDLADESVWLGYLPSCASPSDPRFFYFPNPSELQNGDFPYPEGDVFTDITDQCGVGGKAGRRSILAPGLVDTRLLDGDRDVANADCSDPNDGVLECKLQALEQLADDYRCIKGKVKKNLQKVIQKFEKGNNDCGLEALMDVFIDGVDSASQSRNFSRSCDLSDAADLIARAESANYMFGKLCTSP